MNARFVLVFLLVLVFGLSAGASTTQAIGMSLAAQTINLQFQGERVTVHANIPFAYAVRGSVALDGISADVEKADGASGICDRLSLIGSPDDRVVPANVGIAARLKNPRSTSFGTMT